jgi:dipeptidyl aminopeptidase/acylaminoacyl peptidase
MRHRALLLFLALAGVAFPLRAQAADGAVWTPDLAFRAKRVGSVVVSPDGSRVAYVVGTAQMDGEKSEWLSQIHVARSDGSSSLQLTAGDKSANAPAWSPDSKWIAFVTARGGKPNLWRIRVDGGEAEALTDEKGSVQSPQWSPDGGRIAFLMSEPPTEEDEKAQKEKRDARVVDEDLKPIRLYVVSAEKDPSGKRPVRGLTPVSLSVGDVESGGKFDWSPDGKEIVFSHRPTPKVDDWPKADISVVNVESSAVRALVATPAAESQPFFSRDGSQVAYTASDVPPTWGLTTRVHVVPVSGATPKPLAETYDRQPDLLGWSGDGKRLVVSEAHRTVNRLSALPADGGAPVDLSPPETMVTGPSLDRTGKRVGFVSQATDRAPEAFVSPVEAFSPTPVSRAQELPAADFGKTEVITWKSADGKTIEGLLTTPAGYAPETRVPLLVAVHGGPTGVFLRTFTGVASVYPTAVFAGRGYAILRCNVRGSSGYGRDFRYANYRDWGGGDFKDIMAGVDAVVARGVADPERLGVMGWSYGGFMTSWIITQTKRFKAASVGAGVTNLVSFTGTADIPGFIPDYFGGDYWDFFDRWRTHSAMFNVKGVTTPTLIQHGEADLRVPLSQGYELYNALKRQGVTTKMVVYPRQPHGLQEPKLVKDAMERNLEWFDRWVMGKASSPGGR